MTEQDYQKLIEQYITLIQIENPTKDITDRIRAIRNQLDGIDDDCKSGSCDF